MGATKLETLLGKYQGNYFPGMGQSLARHLGVSSESLTRLALGWAPIVNFKKGPNYQGWWVIPERDARGEVVGLGLRSQSDMKVMYPGSKHGLIYEVNPEHERGGIGYQHGAQNWVRTADAQRPCPVCGKPDGCLLSSEDLDDPKAVICIRVREGAEKPMKFGYLHVRKAEGRVSRSSSLLLPSDHPVVIVEGMTDTAAAMDLGFVAVGRPSNLACMSELADLVRGRPVVIVGENDDINHTTGQRPGHEGMVAAFQILRRICPGATMVLPPEDVKDLRQWRERYGLTAEAFIEYVEQHGRQHAEDTVLPDDKPLTIARAWLDAEHRMAGRYTLRLFGNQWFRYTGPRYEEVDEGVAVRGPLYVWCDNKFVKTVTANGETKLDPLHCTRSMVNNLTDAMLGLIVVEANRIPTWINGVEGPDPRDLIAYANGILHVPSYLEGRPDALIDSTPDFFTLYSLPYPFDPTAACPNWEEFLQQVLGDDQAKIDLLQEWFGYCLTTDTSFQKMMLMRGPRRSGKGTTLAVLQAVVGDDLSGSVTFAKLTERFGLEGLVGKQVAFMGDARLPTGGDPMRALETLLNIVGEDTVNIDRKHPTPALPNHKLVCRFTLATNELPELPDHAGALEARLNVLDFNHTFFGREDIHLRDRLIEEAPGIALWAIEGLRRLRQNGRFTVPEQSVETLREWRRTTSPTSAFLEECVDGVDGEEPDAWVLKSELYEAWSGWSSERGMRVVTKSVFFERLKANAPFSRSETFEHEGRKFSVFKGLKLKKWAAKQYCGKVE